MSLVDGIKCLAKDPLQFMDSDSFACADDSITLSQPVSLESILG